LGVSVLQEDGHTDGHGKVPPVTLKRHLKISQKFNQLSLTFTQSCKVFQSSSHPAIITFRGLQLHKIIVIKMKH